MTTLRVGLIGTGYWAKSVHGASVRHHPDADLVGVWGRDASKAADLATELGTRAYAEYDALVAEVDALTFAVPPEVQCELAVRAAEAGKHLLLEKPIATSVADAERLEDAAARAHVASIVFFTRRFVSETNAWLQRVNDLGGWDCGRAEFASSALVDGGVFSHSPWRYEKGGLWDVGPHALSLLLPVLGDVTTVLAGGGRGDQIHLVMRHADDASSTASLSMTVPPTATGNTLYVYGPSGRMVAPSTGLAREQIIEAHGAALDALINQIARPGTGHACDVRFGLHVVQILAAAERSLATGHIQRVDAT